ncbi:MAG: tRNA epoxyqueuosine(34) reductase QueG [Rubellimicrobium sp.]|nr:tRNA epoxyqueuosine(34) reductase QueG [Rubellimicrobium sp.]
MKEQADLRARLEAKALDEGFVAMGICRPGAIPEAAGRLRDYLDAGRHGDMAWMAERVDWRGDPAALWPEARSVIMLAQSYTPEENPLPLLDERSKGVITSYARGRDYHDLLKKKLKVVGRWLIEQAPEAAIKVFTDTAPVMEKPLAQAAGLGWQGKHTVVISRDFGNWVFLGAIFTTLELPVDAPAEEHCGTCTACLDVCPTQAFPAPFQLDARRCISYLTIEHRGPVDEELRPLLGNHVFGCDDCLAVCPWNKFAVQAHEMRYHKMAGALPLAELAVLDDASFREMFAGSPVKRTGRDRFVRNVLYAIGNSGDLSLRAVAAGLVDDADEAVADAARWAVARLDGAG